ncbi:60S ribosomal protein L6E [Carpediemonas membranifera]|uniref:60S ribosomal protein L6E n=1 Tax=Carpediemonas membranifera TaxID=201153 RepID=A0A8J6B3M5_9EUKA|nr:60S ribosomal protein L6E [Carpediemonas membranifera]|eukprot:KAG9397635.1 60S ribosomal protein L6E [Carpediemonas membranifera]
MDVRFAAPERIPKPLVSYKANKKGTVLKKNLVPGSIVILLAGRYAGSRAVFLKQLDSGLLLVTGPHKVNGVPLRRVNQRYVIGTSTSIDVSKVDLSNVSEEWFKHSETVLPALAETQKTLDATLLAEIKKVDSMKAYMKSKFSLKKGDRPHDMVF